MDCKINQDTELVRDGNLILQNGNHDILSPECAHPSPRQISGLWRKGIFEQRGIIPRHSPQLRCFMLVRLVVF
jgi:hypothetical protein